MSDPQNEDPCSASRANERLPVSENKPLMDCESGGNGIGRYGSNLNDTAASSGASPQDIWDAVDALDGPRTPPLGSLNSTAGPFKTRKLRSPSMEEQYLNYYKISHDAMEIVEPVSSPQQRELFAQMVRSPRARVCVCSCSLIR